MDVNSAEKVRPEDGVVCRPGFFRVEIRFMFWTQGERFLRELFRVSRGRIDVSIEETVGGYTVLTVKASHKEGLKEIYDAYAMANVDFVDSTNVVQRNET